MTGAKAQLTMSVSIVARDEAHEYQGVSFFHPRVFESVLTDYLNASYGHKGTTTGGGLRRHGPVGWKPLKSLPIFGASFRVYEIGYSGKPLDMEDLIIFPVSPKHFIKVFFSRDIYSKDRSGPHFDTTPIDELQEFITNSIQLELGAETQAEYDRIATDGHDMSLTDNFAPLKWPIDPSAQVSTPRDSLL